MKKNIAMTILAASLLFSLAAKVNPIVVVLDPYRLQIGNVAVALPENIMASQDKETGNVTLMSRSFASQRCNAQTEKMIGANWDGSPVCAPEGAGYTPPVK